MFSSCYRRKADGGGSGRWSEPPEVSGGFFDLGAWIADLCRSPHASKGERPERQWKAEPPAYAGGSASDFPQSRRDAKFVSVRVFREIRG